MPHLQPLKVPWKVSPSTPCLGVSTKSLDGLNHGIVTFMGFLGKGTNLRAQYGAYRQIAVILESVVGVRMYPEFSRKDSERLERYDWDLVPEFRDDDGSLRHHFARFHDRWNETDVCPDPAAYLVENSDWLEDLNFTSDVPSNLEFQHYIFLGDDYNVEVIAKSYRWEIISKEM